MRKIDLYSEEVTEAMTADEMEFEMRTAEQIKLVQKLEALNAEGKLPEDKVKFIGSNKIIAKHMSHYAEKNRKHIANVLSKKTDYTKLIDMLEVDPADLKAALLGNETLRQLIEAVEYIHKRRVRKSIKVAAFEPENEIVTRNELLIEKTAMTRQIGLYLDEKGVEDPYRLTAQLFTDVIFDIIEKGELHGSKESVTA